MQRPGTADGLEPLPLRSVVVARERGSGIGDLFPHQRSPVSRRIDRSWVVSASFGNYRCVDLFSRPDGTFGFEEFRRDVEDGGLWTPVAYFSERAFPTRAAAEAEALRAVPWLAEHAGSNR